MLRRLFNDYDDDKNEKLDSEELSNLLSEVVPTSSPAEHAFFESMVDVEGRGAVTFDTFSKVFFSVSFLPPSLLVVF